MALDFTTVRDKLKSKGGYTVSPLARMLDDLKSLLIDMTAQRALGSCPSNAAFDSSCRYDLKVFNTCCSLVVGLYIYAAV